MSKITLQAGSTFWFDYPASPPARHVFAGSSFEIDSSDFPKYAIVGTELLAGKLPTDKPAPFAERILTKVKEAVAGVPPAPGSADSGRFACPDCGQVFTAQRGLDIHAKNAHKVADPVTEAKE